MRELRRVLETFVGKSGTVSFEFGFRITDQDGEAFEVGIEKITETIDEELVERVIEKLGKRYGELLELISNNEWLVEREEMLCLRVDSIRKIVTLMRDLRFEEVVE